MCRARELDIPSNCESNSLPRGLCWSTWLPYALITAQNFDNGFLFSALLQMKVRVHGQRPTTVGRHLITLKSLQPGEHNG